MSAKPSKHLIYGLIDPRTGQLRYVGKSSSGLIRPKAHAQPHRLAKERTRKRNWIVSLKNAGLTYDIEVLEEIEDSDYLCDAECFWIGYFKSIGCDLLNHTRGGEGCLGRVVSQETKEKIRRANLGNTNGKGRKPRELTPEERDRARRITFKQMSDPANREKIAAALRGKKLAPEVRAKMSRSRLGIRKGISLTEEHKAKLRGPRRRVSIHCSNGKLYPSIQEAAEDIGCVVESIYVVLSGRKKHIKRLTFSYDLDTRPPPYRSSFKKDRSVIDQRGTIMTAREFAEHLGVPPEAILNVADGKRSRFRNYTFKYTGF